MEARFIIDPAAPGVRNMAVDEALLIDAADHNTAALRFYSWSEPTLSLGYFQNYADRDQHAASRGCAVVRRQTGGGAILHDRELTYSLVLPSTHPLSKQNEQLYEIVHQVFIEILTVTSQVSNARCSLKLRGETARNEPSDEPFLCFQRRSSGDVIYDPEAALNDATLSASPPATGCVKIIGSAQRRYRNAILQHGSLLLDRSPRAPELAGWENFGDRKLSINAVIATSARLLAERLNIDLQPTSFPPELESFADRIANNKYGTSDWTKRR